MPSQVMAVVPVIMNSLHKDVMRGRKERLGELWVPICSSAMFDPQVMLDMATNGMFVVQTYGATETCGDGIINYVYSGTVRFIWAIKSRTVCWCSFSQYTTTPIFLPSSFTIHSCTAGHFSNMPSSSSGLTFSPLSRMIRFFLRPVM